MNVLILLCIFAAAGALLRHSLSSALNTEKFPWGIAVSNLTACLIAVLLVKCGLDSDGFLSTGFVATLSTFSSMNHNLLEMLRHRRFKCASEYFAVNALGTAAVIVILSV